MAQRHVDSATGQTKRLNVLRSATTLKPPTQQLRPVGARSDGSALSMLTSVDRTCSSASHRCLIGLGSGDFGGEVNVWSPLLCSCWLEDSLPSGSAVVTRRCTLSTRFPSKTLHQKQEDRRSSRQLSVVSMLWLIGEHSASSQACNITPDCCARAAFLINHQTSSVSSGALSNKQSAVTLFAAIQLTR